MLGDRDQLIQVFMNLVRNAADALPETGGEITLTTGYRPGVRFGAAVAGERLSLPLEVTVRDNGAGVPADLMPLHLRSVRHHQARAARGWGWRWSPRSSATMAASSSAIPFRAAPFSASCCPRRPSERRELTMPAGTILVADDDCAIRTVLNQALGRAGYDVRTTGTAAGLWRWVAAGDGNLVITDVVLPDENGFDLIPRIKRLRPESAHRGDERAEHASSPPSPRPSAAPSTICPSRST